MKMDEIKLMVPTRQESLCDKSLTIPQRMDVVENASKKGVGTAISMMKNPSSAYEM